MSAASGNIQQAEESVSTKASGQAARAKPVSRDAEEISTPATDAANVQAAVEDNEASKQGPEAPHRNASKLFATAGHEVTSFVVDEEEDDKSSHDDGQQTVSTTPYDELD